MPTFIAISEDDNPDLDTQGALLFGALCERDRACPRFMRMELHNYLSTITFRWFTNSIQLTMHRAAKSWNSSGAVGDARSSLILAKGNLP